MPKKLTQEEFIARATKVWGDKFDLSQSVYNGASSKVTIICRKHGVFHPTANNFLSGHGCPVCGREIVERAICKDTEYFISKARGIHGDKYDYSKVHYVNNRTKVEIICPEHGSFFQKPNDHLLGKGCRVCGGNMKSTTEEFIEKANKVHHNEYDYSLVQYEGNKKKVKIICPKHGVFEQIPNSHLLGRGCPICQESNGEKVIRRLLEQHGISFEQEKRFDGCVDLGSLRFDFYLPDLNTCIEFQGKQHYKLEPFFCSYDGFIGRMRRDQIKRDYCSKKNIKLIEIKYNENTEIKLTKLWNTQR